MALRHLPLLFFACVLCDPSADSTASGQDEVAKLTKENARLREWDEARRQNEGSLFDALTSKMAEPVFMSDYDRVGFIRLRKVGSTTMHFFLKQTLHYADCLDSQCLYSTGKRLFKCPEGRRDPYQCNHDKAWRIEKRFQEEKEMWGRVPNMTPLQLHEAKQSVLHKVVVLRDPAYRIVSDYFYTLKGEWQPEQFQVWIDMFPEAYQAIQDKDFARYVSIPSDNLNDMTLQLAKMQNKVAQPGDLTQAIHELHTCKLVLLAEYLPQGLMMMNHMFDLSVANEALYKLHYRVSTPDPDREAIEEDPELMAAARKGGWADQKLYEEAKRIFFAVFGKFLKQRNEKFDSIEAALEHYKDGDPAKLPLAHGEL